MGLLQIYTSALALPKARKVGRWKLTRLVLDSLYSKRNKLEKKREGGEEGGERKRGREGRVGEEGGRQKMKPCQNTEEKTRKQE